ncbi:MAG: TolC family protein [Bacteroidales bacterium]|jgi:outer membrane protein TolC|nr:TolC family protein [Bacteroidales bacterium]
MKRITLLTMLLLPAISLVAQRTVTLWQCYDSAAVVSPLSGEREIYSGMTLLRDRNLASAWLPTLDLGGSFNYQSDVVDMSDLLGSIPIPAGSLPSIPHEQYRATVDLSQVIWDGGVTRSAREVESVVSELNMQQSEADLFRLREQVNNYYFSLLLVRSQAEVTAVLISELDARINEASSGVNNGVVPPVTLDVLSAEKIKAEQSAAELGRRSDALAKALEQVTGMTGLKDATLVLPEHVITGNDLKDNPDIRLFDIRSRQIELSKNLLKSQRMPKVFGYAQAGYGNPPGNNFLSDNPDIFFSLGAGVKWNIYDWGKNSNERRSLTLQQQLLGIRKSAAAEALQRLLTLKMAEIESVREAAARDGELIDIRRRIAATAASQLENGVITASQYMTELNSEKQAVITAAARKISIARAETEYMYITGFKTK